MARKTYTVNELLELRGSQTSKAILALAGDPNLGDIVREPGKSVKSGSESSGCTPATTRHKDDSSVTSDELIFKGSMSRRVSRDLAPEPSHNPIRAAPRDAVRDPAREHAKDVVREPAREPSRQMEWKYRGRSETEAGSTEPIPAPTGLPAQRSEGFQRFYKAVVSPTHVRVTAGGRIVPNTRGPPSPTTKRTNDNPVTENQNMTEKVVPAKQPINPAGLNQPIPVVPQFMPGYPPGFQPIQTPVSFVPVPVGTHLPPGLPFAQPAVNPAAINLAAANPAAVNPPAGAPVLADMHNTKPAAVRDEGYAADDKQGAMRISPPELFDYTKPYYYNGQFIYPVGAFPALGNPMIPLHMIGLPHGVAPQLPGHFAPPPPNLTGSMATGTSHAPYNHASSGIPPMANRIVPANANFKGPAAPPISSIKPSDITKKQIASFKHSLKYHEDQLQYNRHQIDEKDMETRIQTIKGHIQRFEETLKTQLEYEALVQRQVNEAKEDGHPSQPVAAAGANRASTQPTAGPEHGTQVAQKDPEEVVRRRVALGCRGVNTNIGEGGRAVFRPDLPSSDDSNRKPSIPSAAVLAPVFQPRASSSSWEGNSYANGEATQEEAEKAPLTAAPQEVARIGADDRSLSRSFTAHPSGFTHAGSSFGSTTGNIGNAGTNGNAAAKHGQAKSKFGVPYLLGTLPKGVNPRTAKDQDYVYHRPLSEAERRARFLYWGKAPKSATQGLPKFDGKHFYPPSPVKEHAGLALEATSDRMSNNRLEIDHRKTESDCDPFRPMTPVERAADSRAMVASEDNCTVDRHIRGLSVETRANGSSEDFHMGGGAPLKVAENGTDARSVASVDRRAGGSGAKLFQAVLKKGPTSSALSSTTAQGFLPQYAGHAAASLSPSLSKNQAPSAKDLSPGRFSDVNDLSDGGGVLLLGSPEKCGENCPPNGMSGLQDQFKNIFLDASGRPTLAPAFSM
ncbi:hypothetical protein VTK56DRAFT_418 [Thermocarpiscus australiensis]